VGAKYGNVEVVRLLVKDERVDLGLQDNLGRTVQGVVGVADFGITNETKLEMIELVKKETERRSLQRNTQKKKSTMRQGDRQVAKIERNVQLLTEMSLRHGPQPIHRPAGKRKGEEAAGGVGGYSEDQDVALPGVHGDQQEGVC